MNRFTLAVALALALPGAVYAQDSDAELNRELDRSLSETYDVDRSTGEPIPDYAGQSESVENYTMATLRSLWGVGAVFLHDLKVVRRDGTLGGDTVTLFDYRDENGDEDDRNLNPNGVGLDFDAGISLFADMEINLDDFFALKGGVRLIGFEEDQAQAIDQGFQLGVNTFSAGALVETRVALLTADLHLSLGVVKSRTFDLEILVGARYIRWEIEVQEVNGSGAPGQSSEFGMEGAVPVFGLQMTGRPVWWCELFVGASGGSLGYETDDPIYVTNGGQTEVQRSEREATMLEAEGGVRFLFTRSIGITGGYRVDYFEVWRDTPEVEEGIEILSHGPYAALFFQF